MTTAATKPKTDEPTETVLPGPPLHGSKYELIRPRTVHPGVIGMGREFDSGNGVIGKVTSVVRLDGAVVRVVIDAGAREAYVDLFGEWMGTVTATGEKWHKPRFVAPQALAAREAIAKLSPKDRADALEGYTPKPAA